MEALRAVAVVQPCTPDLPEEVPVAICYNGSTYAVLMATPADLEDFARGFTLTEELVADAARIEHVEIVRHDTGIELRVWLPDAADARLRARRRRMAGPVGCGLCGLESLGEAVREIRPVHGPAPVLATEEVAQAVSTLSRHQPLHDLTHAVHAAGYWVPGAGFAAVREDVGRHNAVDKLVGALAAAPPQPPGVLVLTSRVSVELVQKAAAANIACIVAVSRPTTLAVRVAGESGVTLITDARGGRHVLRPPAIVRGSG